jgi:hypothetical protein
MCHACDSPPLKASKGTDGSPRAASDQPIALTNRIRRADIKPEAACNSCADTKNPSIRRSNYQTIPVGRGREEYGKLTRRPHYSWLEDKATRRTRIQSGSRGGITTESSQ